MGFPSVRIVKQLCPPQLESRGWSHTRLSVLGASGKGFHGPSSPAWWLRALGIVPARPGLDPKGTGGFSRSFSEAGFDLGGKIFPSSSSSLHLREQRPPSTHVPPEPVALT